jgi:predicted molibdopterin-dependent oxidoreductase YjgC
MVRSGECRGLFVFGEDPIGQELLSSAEAEKLELLLVTTPVLNTLAQSATVVLPGSTPLEIEGSYLIAGKYEKLNKVCPPAERDNLELIDALSAAVSI